MKKLLLLLLFVFAVFTAIPQNSIAQNVDAYPTNPTKTTTKYYLHTGFTFDAVLRTAIFSFNSISPVVAETEYDIRFLDKVMIPKGTKLIGQCNVEKSVNRVNLIFTTMVFPNGQEVQFNGLALHTDGSGGIPGKVVKTKKNTMPAKVLLNAVASGTSAAGVPIVDDMVSGIKDISAQEIEAIYAYYIEIPKNVPIQIFVKNRIEY